MNKDRNEEEPRDEDKEQEARMALKEITAHIVEVLGMDKARMLFSEAAANIGREQRKGKSNLLAQLYSAS